MPKQEALRMSRKLSTEESRGLVLGEPEPFEVEQVLVRDRSRTLEDEHQGMNTLDRTDGRAVYLVVDVAVHRTKVTGAQEFAVGCVKTDFDVGFSVGLPRFALEVADALLVEVVIAPVSLVTMSDLGQILHRCVFGMTLTAHHQVSLQLTRA